MSFNFSDEHFASDFVFSTRYTDGIIRPTPPISNLRYRHFGRDIFYNLKFRDFIVAIIQGHVTCSVAWSELKSPIHTLCICRKNLLHMYLTNDISCEAHIVSGWSQALHRVLISLFSTSSKIFYFLHCLLICRLRSEFYPFLLGWSIFCRYMPDTISHYKSCIFSFICSPGPSWWYIFPSVSTNFEYFSKKLATSIYWTTLDYCYAHSDSKKGLGIRSQWFLIHISTEVWLPNGVFLMKSTADNHGQ